MDDRSSGKSTASFTGGCPAYHDWRAGFSLEGDVQNSQQYIHATARLGID